MDFSRKFSERHLNAMVHHSSNSGGAWLMAAVFFGTEIQIFLNTKYFFNHHKTLTLECNVTHPVWVTQIIMYLWANLPHKEEFSISLHMLSEAKCDLRKTRPCHVSLGGENSMVYCLGLELNIRGFSQLTSSRQAEPVPLWGILTPWQVKHLICRKLVCLVA